MKVSYRWLRALLPGHTASAEETAEILALRGAPVEELVHLAPGLEGLVVARVEAVEPHPGADRLSVCQVDAGGGILQVVCGAPNVQAGVFYPFVPAGAALPDGSVIKAVSIRGVESNGMLCSEAELAMGPDADGIMALEGDFTPGEPLTGALGLDDSRLEVEITANRGDLLSHLGVARELAPSGSRGVRLPPVPGGEAVTLVLESGEVEATGSGVTVRIQEPALCSRYLGAVIRGVKVGPSPAWLATRIRAAGSRPINNVVDATNYVLLEQGQPLHAFDLAKLGESTIVVRGARDGERIRTLDGEDRRLEAGMLAICDASDPVAIAGVMGGADSEVSAETTDVLLECALFDPKPLRATRTALGMSTDASYRFERGVDPAGMELALARAVEIILAVAGGTLDPRVLDVCPRPWTGLTVALRTARVTALLGITLSEDEIDDLLSPLGFEVLGGSGGTMDIAVPGFRSYDVRREVDLLEEVARTYGYDRFPSDLGPFRPGSVPDHPLFQLEDELRDLLVGEGFLEAQTMTFAPEGEGFVEVVNPVSQEEAFLRNRLLPGLIRRTEHNFARGMRDIRLFEVGTVFYPGEPGERPREETHLGLVVTGSRRPLHWKGGSEGFDLWYLKGLLARLQSVTRQEGVSVAEGAPDEGWFVPGEGFRLAGADGGQLGSAGRLEASRIDAPAWAGSVFGLEITLPAEPKPRPVTIFQPLPPYPGVDRDLALLLPRDLPAGRVEEVIRKAAGPLLAGLAVFDLYEGKGIPLGFRSVAFRLRFQSDQRTLTDQDVERSVSSVIDRLREELGVEQRG